ncbi:hypothetical protein FGD67_14255 [Colwellia sp. M166]|uniref:lysoplasmalogenase family protein n=1 Tax=Colwellia sp. M166 TaxID=2583805 RepID=UPI00211EA74B|nr:lysoplasmalogenase family protein [Colwellia sp. M166]UUO24260.1 hypothetical protein FGD67_14255 [Colwellia sp. M166]
MHVTSGPVLKRFSKVAFCLWLFALVQSVLAMLDIVTINQSSTERVLFGIVELLTMALLILNAVTIRNFIAKQNCANAYRFSKICLYSLLFCAAGDIVNRNFPQLFYQYDEVIKHSYLADSVLFFFPGYLMLVIGIAHLAIKSGLSKKWLVISTLLVTVVALVTYRDMHLLTTNSVFTFITASYSILVSILALSAIWLIMSCTQTKIPVRLWYVAVGLVLAMIADALIGKFWIFGAQGQGYFPLVSHINWIIYFGSQALIQQLPIALLQIKQHHNHVNAAPIISN